MVSVETISIVFTGLSVSLAAFYYISTLRNAQKTQQQAQETRQAQLFMQAYNKFIDKEFQQNYMDIVYQHEWDDYDDWWEKYGPATNSGESSKRASVLSYFEGLGVFVEQNLIDIELVSRLGSQNIIWCWEKYSPLWEEYTRRTGSPYTYEYMGWLYNELKTKRHKIPIMSQEIET